MIFYEVMQGDRHRFFLGEGVALRYTKQGGAYPEEGQARLYRLTLPSRLPLINILNRDFGAGAKREKLFP